MDRFLKSVDEWVENILGKAQNWLPSFILFFGVDVYAAFDLLLGTGSERIESNLRLVKSMLMFILRVLAAIFVGAFYEDAIYKRCYR